MPKVEQRKSTVILLIRDNREVVDCWKPRLDGMTVEELQRRVNNQEWEGRSFRIVVSQECTIIGE